MSKKDTCEYCSRIITSEPVNKLLRKKRHIFCSEFCFRLYFYNAPTISYEELQKMYSYYCVSLQAEDYHKTVRELIVKEDHDDC
jgi:hypothetical protein